MSGKSPNCLPGKFSGLSSSIMRHDCCKKNVNELFTRHYTCNSHIKYSRNLLNVSDSNKQKIIEEIPVPVPVLV